MASFLDCVRFTPAAGGTIDWTYASSVAGYQSPSAAGAANGAVYRYRAESADLSQWEIGFGVWNSSAGVLSRGTVTANSAGTTAKINFTAAPQVAVVALSADLTRVNHLPGGRLTLSSGVAVMTTDVAAATTLYYTPSTSPYVPIYNGSDVLPYQFTSSPTDTVGLTMTIGSNWTAATIYDVFVTLKGGLPTLVVGPAWTSAAAAASTRGYTLASFMGLLTNAAAMTVRDTNSSTFTVPANQATYVGLIFINGTGGQIDMRFGSAAAGGGSAVNGVWNFYNRVESAFSVIDTNASWNVPAGSTSTWMTLDASSGNRMNFFTGLGDDPIDALLFCTIGPTNGNSGKIGLGLSSLTSVANRSVIFGAGNATGSGAAAARVYGVPGNNYIQALQYATDTSTVFATGGPTQQGLLIKWWW